MTERSSPDSVQTFAEELRKWWSFDERQHHTHSWHDRENFIERKLPELLKPPFIGCSNSLCVYYAGRQAPVKDDVAQGVPATDIAEKCARIAERHVGAGNSPAYDEACRDIAKAIRDAMASRSAALPHAAPTMRELNSIEGRLIQQALVDSGVPVNIPPQGANLREALLAAQAHLLKYTGGFAANAEEAALFEKIKSALSRPE